MRRNVFDILASRQARERERHVAKLREQKAWYEQELENGALAKEYDGEIMCPECGSIKHTLYCSRRKWQGSRRSQREQGNTGSRGHA